jgi:hypothetical protein
MHLICKPSLTKPFVIKTGLVALGVCVGAAAMYAWQARSGTVEGRPALSRGSMSGFISDLHNSAHVDNLPVQRIDDLY